MVQLPRGYIFLSTWWFKFESRTKWRTTSLSGTSGRSAGALRRNVEGMILSRGSSGQSFPERLYPLRPSRERSKISFSLMVLVRLQEWRLNYMLLFNIEDGKEKLKTIRNYFSGDICPGNAELSWVEAQALLSETPCSSIFSIASLAANCSASFLRRAVPVPRSSSLQVTVTVKVFACSAPASARTA